MSGAKYDEDLFRAWLALPWRMRTALDSAPAPGAPGEEYHRWYHGWRVKAMNEAELVLERLQAASSDTPEGKVFGNQIKDWTPEDQRRAEEAYSRGEWPLDHCPRCGASDGKHATGCPCAPPLPRTGKESEFANYVVEMKVRISRLPSFREPDPQSEDTIAEVIAAGGALVQTTIEIIKGEIVEFSISNAFKTRAEVAYVSTGQLPGLDGIRRLGLKFLDAPLPKQLIPPDAKVQQ